MINKFKFLILFLVFFLIKNSLLAQIDIKADYVIIQDSLSGKILYEKNADMQIYPASMTKIMTALVVFDLIKKGETSLDELMIVSEKAWRMSKSGYSSMFVMPNDKISVEDLLRGIIVVSGNDACLVLAEGIAGTEDGFAELMNKKVKEIGLLNTNFSNSSGINDVNNYSTVKDIAILSNFLIKNYPEYYHYFKETSYTWDRTGGDPITQGNRNPLLYKNLGVDGLKTGYLAVEKYSLASSIKTKQRRIIAVGSGFKTKRSRSKESAKMLTWGIRNFDTIKIAKKNQPFIDADVWLGKKDKVPLYIKEDLYVTIPKRKKNSIKAVIEYHGPVEAPIEEGQNIGKLNIFIDNNLEKKLNVYASEAIKKVNIFSRLIKSINFLVWGDV